MSEPGRVDEIRDRLSGVKGIPWKAQRKLSVVSIPIPSSTFAEPVAQFVEHARDDIRYLLAELQAQPPKQEEDILMREAERDIGTLLNTLQHERTTAADTIAVLVEALSTEQLNLLRYGRHFAACLLMVGTGVCSCGFQEEYPKANAVLADLPALVAQQQERTAWLEELAAASIDLMADAKFFSYSKVARAAKTRFWAAVKALEEPKHHDA